MSLDELLDYVSVYFPGDWENELSTQMGNWYAVSAGDDNIIAYFFNKTDAFRFRLDYINRKLNP